MTFTNNKAISSAGQTIALQNTFSVHISDAHFEKNLHTNILVDMGFVTISNSTFTEG